MSVSFRILCLNCFFHIIFAHLACYVPYVPWIELSAIVVYLLILLAFSLECNVWLSINFQLYTLYTRLEDVIHVGYVYRKPAKMAWNVS
jgi:hypothetical protein